VVLLTKGRFLCYTIVKTFGTVVSRLPSGRPFLFVSINREHRHKILPAGTFILLYLYIELNAAFSFTSESMK
jgi:hypothetical protein